MRYALAPRRYSEPSPGSGFVSRISEDLRRAVVFLGWQKEGPIDEAPIDPRGVGFLVLGQAESGGGTYLVTAGHVAEKLVPPFVIRFNKKEGGSELVHVETPKHIQWFFHPDQSVDLAVAPIEMPAWADHLRYNMDSVIKYAPLATELGAGDGVYVVGMFHFVHGSRRNLPAVYRGSIVLLPEDERLPVDQRSPMEGYLVQANTISGCSGAPVWASRLVQVEPTSKSLSDGTVFWAEGMLSLVGFWVASWKVKNTEIVGPADDAGKDGRGSEDAPLGMGVVVPVAKLIEIFQETDVAKERTAIHGTKRAEKFATPDFLSRSSAPADS